MKSISKPRLRIEIHIPQEILELKVIWLRASYWIGAIAGFLIALPIVLSAPPAFAPGKFFFPFMG